MPWCKSAGKLVIGPGSVISPNCVVYGTGEGGVEIGARVECGPGVGIFASRTDYHRGPGYHLFAPVLIGDEAIIFANAVIGPGVSIGRNAVVAAGSVVTRDVPTGALVGGSPARVIAENVRDEKGSCLE